MIPVQHISAAAWPIVGQRFSSARKDAGYSIERVATAIESTAEDVSAFEEGQGTLGIYDLRVLAELWGTTTGAWFCGDETPLYRSSDSAAADEAARIGAELMARYLAKEALAEQ